MSRNLTLGLVASYKSGLTALRTTGQDARLIEKYIKAYLTSFQTIYYFSYFSERLEDFTSDPQILSRVQVLPRRWNIHPFLYGLLMPIAYWKEFRQCAVFRVFQATGILPFLGPWSQSAKCLVTFGYSYSEFAKVEGKPRWKVWTTMALERIAAWRSSIALVTTRILYERIALWRRHEGVALIPNGVDLKQFDPSTTTRARSKTKTILYIGRLEKQKNLANLILGTAVLQKMMPVKLLWIGDGSQRESLETLARAHDVNLTISPPVPHAKLPEVFREADVFALVSHIEGHPKILIEAMSAGVPCVVSECEGNQDLTSHGRTAYTCPPTDVQAIARALGTALQNPDASEEITRNARTMVETRFDLSRLIQDEIRLLEDLAATSKLAYSRASWFLQVSFLCLSAAFLGNILLDKTFAYIHFSVAGRPVYITDTLLALSLFTLLLSGRARPWRLPAKWLTGMLALSFSLSLLRGVIIYGMRDAMRDAMLIGYMLAGYLVFALVTQVRTLSPALIRLVQYAACFVIGARLLSILGNLFLDSHLPLQPACSAMYMSGLLILAIHSIKPHKKWLYYGAQILLVSMLFLVTVRSAWLAWLLILSVTIVLHAQNIFFPRFCHFLIGVIPASISIAILLSLIQPNRLMKPLLSDLRTLVAFVPSMAGSSMGNVHTRFWMWQSAYEEILIGRTSREQTTKPDVQERFDARKQSMERSGRIPSRRQNHVTDPDLWQRVLEDPLAGWARPLEPGVKKAMVDLSSWPLIRLLFGMPMGKVFVPAQVSYWLDVPRYDPHNSFVAVLYRNGHLGTHRIPWLSDQHPPFDLRQNPS